MRKVGGRSVPGGVYTDLLDAGILTTDPYYRFNDQKYRWVSKTNWTYSTTVNVGATLIASNKYIVLDCKGSDKPKEWK